jgi:hypothetical protein
MSKSIALGLSLLFVVQAGLCCYLSVRTEQLEYALGAAVRLANSEQHAARLCNDQVSQCWAWRSRVEMAIEETCGVRK